MATIAIEPPELARYVETLTPGNIDLVGKLSVELSALRADYGKLFAKLHAIEAAQRQAKVEIDELRTETRRLAGMLTTETQRR